MKNYIKYLKMENRTRKWNPIIDRLKILILILTISLSASNTFSQEDDSIDSTKHEKVEQLKIAYITNELNLTSSEAERFWPVYNELSSKMKNNRKERKRLTQELRDKTEQLKDEEIKKKLNLIFENETVEITRKKEYISKISDIIGFKKAAKLLNLEQDFKRELLKRLKDDKRQGSRQNTNQRAIRRN